MGKVPPLRETIPPPQEVTEAGLNGDLVFFVGAGISRLLGLPSWQELATKILEDLRKASLLNYSEIDQLKGLDPKKQLSIAKLIAEQNQHKLDVCQHLVNKNGSNGIYKTINEIGCSCVTTNYDELLAPSYSQAIDGSETPSASTRVADPNKFFANLLNKPGTVVHLHGCVSKPETMILSTKDYLEHYDHPNVQEFLSEMFVRKTVVFLGYGLGESEILEHILRRGRIGQTADRRRFVVQGFFNAQNPLYEKLHNYYERSFGVHLLGFILDHESHSGLEATIKDWASRIRIQEPPLVAELEQMRRVLAGE